MTPRIDIRKYVATEAGQALISLGRTAHASTVEPALLELVKLRTSQINGCAYCIDMHTKDARALGETEQRLYTLSAWREAPFYSERERAALEWTEALALVSDSHMPDDAYDRMTRHFDEAQLVAVTIAAVATYAWNRLVLSFRVPAGTYEPQPEHA